MNRRPISKTGLVALAIGVAAVTLTLLLLVRPMQALIGANSLSHDANKFDNAGAGPTVTLLAERSVATTNAAVSTSPWAAALTRMSNAGSIGMVSGAADGIYSFSAGHTNFLTRFTADVHDAIATSVDKTSIGNLFAPNAVTQKAVSASSYYRTVSTYYRSVATVMAVFGLIAIVTGCIALRRSPVHRDEG